MYVTEPIKPLPFHQLHGPHLQFSTHINDQYLKYEKLIIKNQNGVYEIITKSFRCHYQDRDQFRS